MPTHVTCPKCRRALSVAGPLGGKRVKCPDCGTLFTDSSEAHREAVQAVPPSTAVVSRPAPPLRMGAGDELLDDREEALARVRRPANCLMFSGALGMILTVLCFVGFALFVKGFPMPLEHMIVVGLTTILNFMSNSLLIYGANEMRMLGNRTMALVACIVALLNMPNGCLTLSIPFGIWGLIVISHPDVALAFRGMQRNSLRG
jgi:hypothetical protein